MTRHLVLLVVLAGCASKTTLTQVQGDVFTPSCAFSACHLGTSGASALDLTDGKSYTSLVNKPSAAATGETLVIPGNSTDSYVIKKLENAPGIVGVQMPNTGVPLDQTFIDEVKAWIDDGALDN